MKNIILLILLSASLLIAKAQTYKVGASMALGQFTKNDGNIVITDSTVIMAYQDIKPNHYSIVKKTNNLVYFTDGVMTHLFAITDEAGRKKGFDYDTTILFKPDQRQSAIQMVFYTKKTDVK